MKAEKSNYKRTFQQNKETNEETAKYEKARNKETEKQRDRDTKTQKQQTNANSKQRKQVKQNLITKNATTNKKERTRRRNAPSSHQRKSTAVSTKLMQNQYHIRGNM